VLADMKPIAPERAEIELAEAKAEATVGKKNHTEKRDSV